MTDVNNVMGLWRAFRAFAIHQVREGFKPEWTKGCQSLLLFAVLHEPSFADVVGWQILQVTCADLPPRYIAQRTLWKQSRDSQLISSPIDRLAILARKYSGFPLPTMEYAAVAPDTAVIQDMVQRMDNLRLPLAIELDRIGLDGTHYELIAGRFAANSVLRWWGEAPAEWAEAGAIVMETLRHLEALYKKR